MTSQRVDSGHEGGTSRRSRSRSRSQSLATAALSSSSSSSSSSSRGPETAAAEWEVAPGESLSPAESAVPLEPVAFCREVMTRGSVEAACEARGVSLEAYTRERLTNPAFDEAALMADQVLDLRIVDQVRKAAQQEGGLASQTLYFRAVRTEASQAAFPTLLRGRPGLAEAPALPPEVAAAIIRAGLEAHEKLQRAGGKG